MNFRALFILLAVALCPPLTAQTANPKAADQGGDGGNGQLYGTLQDGLYTSPTGAFQVKVPVLPELGGTVADTRNVVTFHDAFTTHVTIGAFPLSAELKWEYQTRGPKNFLIYFFTTLVMPDFAKRFPGASIENDGLFLPKFQNGSMLIFTLLPGGSFFANRVTLFPRRKPLVAKRGNLCFVKNGYVFVVSEELADHILSPSVYHRTTAEENAVLRRRLVALVEEMHFLKQAAPQD